MKIGNVLSVFDGMGCAKLALDRAGITYDNYYASEIDTHAIKQTKAKGGNIIHLGSVTDVRASNLLPIDILLGGSPCQGFSFAGKGLNFEDPRSKLFFEFVRLLKECREINPSVKFLLENVRMKKEHENVISELLEIQPILINSALVCAQNRERLYWTNIAMVQEGLFGHNKCSIPQPKDTNVLLRDILQDNVDDKYYISEKALARMLRKAYSKPKVNPDKTGSLNTKNNSGQLSVDSGTTLVTHRGHAGELMIYAADKSPALKVGGQDDINIAFEDRSKAPCLTVGGNGAGNNSDSELLVFGVLNDNGELRATGDKSTCVDANYFKGVDSHAQRTMIGDFRGDEGFRWLANGKSPTLKARGESEDIYNSPLLCQEIIVHSTAPRSGDPTKGGTGSLSWTDGKTYCLQTTQSNLLEFTEKQCDALRGRDTENGIEQQIEPRKDDKTNTLTSVQKDNMVLEREIKQLNPNTESGGVQPYQQNRIYSSDGLIPSLLAEMSSGTHAVLHNSRIRRLTPIECCRLQTVPDDYFFNEDGSKIVSESQMYKMLGNGWTVDVIVHVLNHWK